ncbi:hypothetical protein [Acetobacter vaccinii]|uniref:Uncharacterized protein n=1 Tax=Acetobacter vaccinii TaxID=2592655 RepID=A0A5C1YP91_9PROT|nr:hypothetical protein [Acetobacter vaccinii]QEO17643.1 hypothetical protein FLP30_07825 [Acetobacter vaccinii]
MPYIDDTSVCSNDEIHKIMDEISSEIQNAKLGWRLTNNAINRFVLSDISIIWRYVYNKNDIVLAKNFYHASWLFFHKKDSFSAQIILNIIKGDLNLNAEYYATNIDNSYYSYLCEFFYISYIICFLSFFLHLYSQMAPTSYQGFQGYIGFFMLNSQQLRDLSITLFMSCLGSLFAWNRKNVFAYIDSKDQKTSMRNVHWNIKKSQTLAFQSAALGVLVFLLKNVSNFFFKFDVSNMFIISIFSFSVGMGGVLSEKFIKRITDIEIY